MVFNEEALVQSNEIRKHAFLFQFIIASQAKQSHTFVTASQAKQSRKNKYFFSYEIATLPSVTRNDTSQDEINTLCSQ